MNNVRPSNLTDSQWLLLQHLYKYNAPFYTEAVYIQFAIYQMSRLEFYRMFFTLAILSYISMDGQEELIPGQKFDFSCKLTPKGKNAVTGNTWQVASNYPLPLKAEQRIKGIIAAYLPKTTRLKDYKFYS